MKSAFQNRKLVVWAMLLGLAVTPAFAQRENTGEASKTSDIAVPAGPALSEGEIIILLQAKVPLDLIEKFVSVRGVSFTSTKDSSKKLLAAGGNVSLIGTISLNQKEEALAAMGIDANGKKKK